MVIMELGTLRVTTPDGQVREYPIERMSVTVGRSEANGVVIDHVSVSRRHAILKVEGEKVSVEDVGSASGTFVGSQRISPNSAVSVETGQTIRFGDVEARFYLPMPEGTITDDFKAAAQAGASVDTQSTIAVSLTSPSAPVAAGATTTASVVIQNRGQSVDQVTISVPDLPAPWVRLSRSQLTMVPGARDEITVVIQPARTSETRAGEQPLSIAVVSRENGREVRVLGKLNILPFEAFTMGMKASGTTGDFKIETENQGNVPLEYQFAATNDDENLDFTFQAETVELQPGEKRTISLHAKPRGRPLFGRVEQRKFKVSAKPARAGSPEGSAEGRVDVRPPFRNWRAMLVAASFTLMAIVGTVAYFSGRLPDIPGGGGSKATPTAVAVGASPTAAQETPKPVLAMRNGGNAVVVHSSPVGDQCLRVRTLHTRLVTTNVLDKICDGQIVKLTSDAVSEDQFIWWQVEYTKDGKTVAGWAAEKPADGSDHFLEPAP